MFPLHIKLPRKEVFEAIELLKLSNLVKHRIYCPKTLKIGHYQGPQNLLSDFNCRARKILQSREFLGPFFFLITYFFLCFINMTQTQRSILLLVLNNVKPATYNSSKLVLTNGLIRAITYQYWQRSQILMKLSHN